jgi:hypothetical protein
MMRGLICVAAVMALLALGGCYRLQSPPDLDETVRIEVVGDQARLVRSQAYLVDAIDRSLVERLGWRVSPTGTARLQIAIQEERIRANADDDRGVTNSWQIRVRGTALLVARGGSLTTTFSGVGNATSLAGIQGEPEALRAAATQAAEDLTGWLDVHASTLIAPSAAPSPAP